MKHSKQAGSRLPGKFVDCPFFYLEMVLRRRAGAVGARNPAGHTSLLRRGILTRSIPGYAFALLACCGSAAGDDRKKEKLDAAKMVGRWGPKDKKAGVYTLEFRSDGMMVLTGTVAGREQRWDGKYRLEGSRLSVELRSEAGEWLDVNTITKLTDTDLDGKEASGKTFSLVRLKEK
jgi:uncharacterized protein (TIGR03066 family)